MLLPKSAAFAFFILLVLALSQSSVALPSSPPVNGSSILLPRQCIADANAPSGFKCDENMPTVQEIVDRLHDRRNGGWADANHRVIFYTGLGVAAREGAVWWKGWMQNQGWANSYYWAEEGIDRSWYRAQRDWLLDHDDVFAKKYSLSIDAHRVFQGCYCEALATAAIHQTAILFTTEGVDPLPNSYWTTVEFPSLTTNPNIKEIYKVDPRPPQVKGIPEDDACLYDRPVLLWSRHRGDAEIPRVWNCPIVNS